VDGLSNSEITRYPFACVSRVNRRQTGRKSIMPLHYWNLKPPILTRAFRTRMPISMPTPNIPGMIISNPNALRFFQESPKTWRIGASEFRRKRSSQAATLDGIFTSRLHRHFLKTAISYAPYILWSNPLDTQDTASSYTQPNEKEVLIISCHVSF